MLGFKTRTPDFFILARFSDSGTFPLYHQLVADTIEFLKGNLQKLDGFDLVRNPYWYNGEDRSENRFGNETPGSVLKEHVSELLSAFEWGILFDWLRNEDDKEERFPVPTK